MNADISLTIAIPTHNGARFLAKTLDSILTQVGIDPREAEILISDNASTDSTRDIVSYYLKEHPELISYYRNDENTGYDRNVDILFKKAKGSYVQLMGDDDFYKDNLCLHKILTTLKNHPDTSVLLLSVDFLDIFTNEITPGFRMPEDMIFENGDEFFTTTKWASSAVSSLIIKKKAWNGINIEKYFGSLWVHVGALISILRGKAKSYMISDTMIVVRTNNTRWQEHGGNQLECGLKHLGMFEEMGSLGYMKETFVSFLKDRYKNNLRDIVFLKPKKIEDKIRVASLMMKYFKYYPLFWILHLPAIFLPKFIFYPIIFMKSPIHFSKKIVYKWKDLR